VDVHAHFIDYQFKNSRHNAINYMPTFTHIKKARRHDGPGFSRQKLWFCGSNLSLNNLVEQDHRAIKRIILRHELGFEMNTHLLALGNGSSAVS
jgi:hypothetical protein